jgi:phosphoribosylanthranilate isomerase
LTRIKICGIMDRTELSAALRAGADAVGFVVEVASSRHCLSAEQAGRLIQQVPLFNRSVAVIAPQDLDGAVSLADATGADILQVHGTLGASDLLELKKRVPQKIVAALSAETNLGEARLVAGSADAILLDTFAGGVLGGTGRVHDWERSARLAAGLSVPVILAGGLHPGNVADAICRVRPYAVDASSGLETEGRKDEQKMDGFVREVRACPPQQ